MRVEPFLEPRGTEGHGVVRKGTGGDTDEDLASVGTEGRETRRLAEEKLGLFATVKLWIAHSCDWSVAWGGWRNVEGIL